MGIGVVNLCVQDHVCYGSWYHDVVERSALIMAPSCDIWRVGIEMGDDGEESLRAHRKVV